MPDPEMNGAQSGTEETVPKTIKGFHSQKPLKFNMEPETPYKIEGQITFEATLKRSYEKHARPLMDTMDNIRSLGLEGNDFQLPKIVVTGDQSVGKSSCLEALSGLKLPRGDGIVTRTPLEIRMRTVEKNMGWRCKIMYTADEKTLSVDINTPADVGQALRKAQEHITGDQISVSDTLITMEVSSPDVPDLTLIDLPGIARFSQENPEIESQIKSMIRNFIKSEQTLIMVVFPAGIDTDTVGAFQLAKDVDPELKRTMAVMTKMDLVGPGSERFVIEVLNNEKLKLGLGVFGVKCRSQRDVESDLSLAAACKNEESFFKSHRYFGALTQGQFGIRKVAEQMVKELSIKIRACLPKMTKVVSDQLNCLKEKLNGLGKGPSVNEETRKRELLSIMTEYISIVEKVCQGDYNAQGTGLKLFAKWREETSVFATKISSITKEGVATSLSDTTILESLKQNRGKELPGFVDCYPLCEQIISELITKWKQPCSTYVCDITNHANSILRTLASVRFDKYPNLSRCIKGIVDDRLQFAISNVDADIEKLFEQEKIVWTQDSTFLAEKDVVLKDEARLKAAVVEGDDTSWTRYVQDIMDGTSAYMRVACRRVIDTIPQTVFYHVLRVLKDQIKAYVLSVACDDSQIVHLFQEREDIAFQRQELTDLLTKWRDAEKQLAAL